MQRTVVGLTLLLLTTAARSIAQEAVAPAREAQPIVGAFAALDERIKAGDIIFVTDRQGRETRGRLQRLSSVVHIARGAFRLAAAGETTSSSVDEVQPGGTSARSDWSRVLSVVTGTEIVVIVRGSQPVSRYFVLADDSGLTVLNVADVTLQFEPGARRVLLNVARHHPEYFKGEFVDNDVRVGPKGVFVAGRKVADLEQIVERLARTDVVEIRAAETRGAGSSGAILGFLIGYVGGLVAGHKIGRAAGADPSNLGFMFWGGVGGGVAGGLLGYRVASRTTDDLIYRAPYPIGG